MKKKYRVTTRGKIVFPLIALLIIYSIYSMVSTPEDLTDVPLVVEEVDNGVETITESNSLNTIDETSDDISNSNNEIMIEASDSTKAENCTTNELKEDQETMELRLIEAAGFTIYYEPNAYYVPEGDLASLAEFASVAIKFPEEQIVIEGNTNTTAGTEEDIDTIDINQLGYTRGLVIKNYLIKQGVDENRVVIYNNKDSKPLNVDQSTESVALNRRVDVFFSQFSYNEINNK